MIESLFTKLSIYAIIMCYFSWLLFFIELISINPFIVSCVLVFVLMFIKDMTGFIKQYNKEKNSKIYKV